MGVLLLLFGNAPGSYARGVDPGAGEELFREGRRLFKAGEIAAACAKFAESHAVDPAPGTLANLAACEEQAGRRTHAWEHWRRVAELLPQQDPRKVAAEQRIAALERALARLIIEPSTTAPAGFTVERDGSQVSPARIGVPVALEPGAHEVWVKAPGREARRFEVMLAAGQQLRLAVEPGPALWDATALPRPTGGDALGLEASAGSRTGRHYGYALLTVGAATAGAGAFFGWRALQARADLKASCARVGDPPLCWARGRDALERDRRYSRMADVGYATGAVAALAGVYLIFRARARTPEIIAMPTPGGAEVRLAARF